ILVGTESVGMGADIPDVQYIVHFGVPPSLSVGMQCAGQVGHSPDIHAEAIMLVKCSVFQQQKGWQ
ncbi:hypothetical protein C8Q73DRAFT_647354, partial [Cubamyces lactineus]